MTIIPLIEEQINQYININFQTKNVKEDDGSKVKQTDLNKLNYPLTALLAKHKIFQNSGDNFQPKTRILDEFCLRLNEPERKNIISYSLVNNKIYQSYLDMKKQLEPVIELSIKCKQNHNPNDQDNFNLNQMLQYLFKNVTILGSLCETLVTSIPGIADLPASYKAKIIKRNSIDLFFLSYVTLYQDGEFYLYFEKGYQMSREISNKIRGKKHTDILFEAFETVNSLNLTDREKSVFLAYIFSVPGKKYLKIIELKAKFI